MGILDHLFVLGSHDQSNPKLGWAKATRQGLWVLEWGRGIVAASIGVIGVTIFATLLPKEIKAASFEERQAAFQTVIYVTSALVAVVGLFIFFFLTEDLNYTQEEKNQKQAHLGKTSKWSFNILLSGFSF